MAFHASWNMLQAINNINMAAIGGFYSLTAVYLYVTYGAYFFPMNDKEIPSPINFRRCSLLILVYKQIQKKL